MSPFLPVLSLDYTPNSYAVLNPEKEFFNDKIIEELLKEFEPIKVVYMTKDKDQTEKVMEESLEKLSRWSYGEGIKDRVQKGL